MSKKRSSKDQNITVAEFKQWLSGVEDMQESGWVPNEEQWKKIRAKIGTLSEDVVDDTPQVQEPVYQQPQYQQPQYQPLPYQPAPQRVPQTSLGDELFIPRATEADGNFDGGQNMSNPGVTSFG